MRHDFRYISKHSPEVKNAYHDLLEIIGQVQDEVRSKFTFSFYPVGSYKRNMITYDTKSNVGFDFDINIEVNDEDEKYSAKEIRKEIKNALNRTVRKYGYDYPEDSKRVLTIKVKDTRRSRIIYSCDFAIVYNYMDENGNKRQQYIRFDKQNNVYKWEYQPKGFLHLPEKIEWLKDRNRWQEVRERYILNKNRNTDPDNHSRSVFAETVHQICQKSGFQWK